MGVKECVNTACSARDEAIAARNAIISMIASEYDGWFDDSDPDFVATAGKIYLYSGRFYIALVDSADSPQGNEANWADLGTTVYMSGPQIKVLYEAEDDTNALTDALKQKLENLESSHFKGVFANFTALQSAYPAAISGDYADVDAGVGADVQRYIWDDTDTQWIIQESATTLTAAQVLGLYESNPDRNAFTDALKAKLESLGRDVSSLEECEFGTETETREYSPTLVRHAAKNGHLSSEDLHFDTYVNFGSDNLTYFVTDSFVFRFNKPVGVYTLDVYDKDFLEPYDVTEGQTYITIQNDVGEDLYTKIIGGGKSGIVLYQWNSNVSFWRLVLIGDDLSVTLMETPVVESFLEVSAVIDDAGNIYVKFDDERAIVSFNPDGTVVGSMTLDNSNMGVYSPAALQTNGTHLAFVVPYVTPVGSDFGVLRVINVNGDTILDVPFNSTEYFYIRDFKLTPTQLVYTMGGGDDPSNYSFPAIYTKLLSDGSDVNTIHPTALNMTEDEKLDFASSDIHLNSDQNAVYVNSFYTPEEGQSNLKCVSLYRLSDGVEIDRIVHDQSMSSIGSPNIGNLLGGDTLYKLMDVSGDKYLYSFRGKKLTEVLTDLKLTAKGTSTQPTLLSIAAATLMTSSLIANGRTVGQTIVENTGASSITHDASIIVDEGFDAMLSAAGIYWLDFSSVGGNFYVIARKVKSVFGFKFDLTKALQQSGTDYFVYDLVTSSFRGKVVLWPSLAQPDGPTLLAAYQQDGTLPIEYGIDFGDILPIDQVYSLFIPTNVGVRGAGTYDWFHIDTLGDGTCNTKWGTESSDTPVGSEDSLLFNTSVFGHYVHVDMNLPRTPAPTISTLTSMNVGQTQTVEILFAVKPVGFTIEDIDVSSAALEVSGLVAVGWVEVSGVARRYKYTFTLSGVLAASGQSVTINGALGQYTDQHLNPSKANVTSNAINVVSATPTNMINDSDFSDGSEFSNYWYATNGAISIVGGQMLVDLSGTGATGAARSLSSRALFNRDPSPNTTYDFSADIVETVGDSYIAIAELDASSSFLTQHFLQASGSISFTTSANTAFFRIDCQVNTNDGQGSFDNLDLREATV